MSGHGLTLQSAGLIAADLRTRRFAFRRKRASPPGSAATADMHYKSPAGGIPAGVIGGQMGSAMCLKYDCNGTGLRTLSSQSDLVYNPFGAIAGNKDMLVHWDDAGLRVVHAVDCR